MTMRSRLRRGAGCTLALVLGLVLLAPADAAAWGLATHRWVARRAAELAAPRCPELAHGRGGELAERAVEPDTLLRARLGEREAARHFLNLDHYGTPPFARLPRDRAAAVRRFGRAAVEREGVLPWHGGSLARRLAREIGRRDWSAARRSAGHLAHYAADATMPLHATENYDGQRSGQRGLHRRVESVLVDERLERYLADAARTPRRAPIAPQASEQALFAALADSYAAVAPVLAADRAARRGTRVGSQLYYRRLDVELERLLADRIGAAAALTAALWEGACRVRASE